MTKQSFIGDMWHCAKHIKNKFESFGEKNVSIVHAHLDGKFSYVVVFHILNYKGEIVVLTWDNMMQNKDIYTKDFNVKCEYILFTNDNDVSFYGVCIK